MDRVPPLPSTLPPPCRPLYDAAQRRPFVRLPSSPPRACLCVHGHRLHADGARQLAPDPRARALLHGSTQCRGASLTGQWHAERGGEWEEQMQEEGSAVPSGLLRVALTGARGPDGPDPGSTPGAAGGEAGRRRRRGGCRCCGCCGGAAAAGAAPGLLGGERQAGHGGGGRVDAIPN